MFETLDFKFMEMKNMGEAMNADEVLKQKGLDLDEIQIHNNNN